MADTDKQQSPWWRELVRKEVVGGHVVGTLVGLAVTFTTGLVMTGFWFAWAAWRGSEVWTQRSIGAAMAFALVIVATATALVVLRQRLTPSSAKQSAVKGYLDHKADSSKAIDATTRTLGAIAKITNRETANIKAGTARLQRIHQLPYDKRLSKELEESRRSARSTDKTSRKLAAQVERLAESTQTYAQAELAYWKWHTAHYPLDAHEARARIDLTQRQLRSIQEYLEALADGRRVTADRLGVSQTLNEAVERRLAILDKQYAAVAAQQAPLWEVIALLEPFTKSGQEERR